MVKHPPYIEASEERTEDTPLSGGIDTTAIDCLRQGVSLRNNRHRYCGTQPKIWAGNLQHHLERQVFGVPGLYPDGDAFDDTGKQFEINAVIDHFRSGNVSVSEAFMGAGDDDGNIESFDGVIEPLEIRRTVLRPGEFKTVRRFYGQYSDGGNYNRRDKADEVRQEIEFGTPISASPFIEQGSVVVSLPGTQINVTGSLLLGAIEPRDELERVKRPFDDARGLTPQVASSLVASGSGREHLIAGFLGLSGSTIVNELDRTESATAGIVYHTSVRGTDSIAFGGLTRYKKAF